MNTKKCPKCDEVKSVDEFYKNSQTKDGLKCYCKDCCKSDNKKREPKYKQMRKQYREDNKYEVREHKRKYYQNNKDTINAQNMAWAKTLKGRFSTYKNQAKYRGIGFYLTEDDFGVLWQIPCHYCGSDIDTIGIDRIDSKGDYIVDNVVPCCTTCNLMKLDLNANVFLTHIEKIYTHKKETV